VQITDQGGYVAFESADGRTLYYTKTGQLSTSSPLFVRPLSGGPERRVLDSVYDRAFAVVSSGIYYIDQPGHDGHYPLKFFEFSSGKSRLLSRIERRPSFGLSVSPDGRQILYSLVTVATADLVLVENFR
jgi:Tol biopolymer transport system component